MENQTQNVVNTTVTAIRKEVNVSPITLDEIMKADFQKEGTLSAQLRQVITTISYYPSKKVSNNLHDNMFSADEFGFEETEFTATENRVTWMIIPEATTVEQLNAKITSLPKSRLYRVLSNKPILTTDQEYAITAGQKTYDEFAEAQVVRYPSGVVDTDTEEDLSGKIVLDTNGKVQYRRVFLSTTGKEDQDLRTVAKEDMFLTDNLLVELNGAGVMAGQTI